MAGSTISILLAQTTGVVQEVVSGLSFKGIEIETGFIRSNLDLTKAYKNHHWDIIILNLDYDEFDAQKAVRTIHRKKARTRIIASGRLRNRNEVNSLLATGVHEFVPITDPALLEIKLGQQLEIAHQQNRTRELEYDLNYKILADYKWVVQASLKCKLESIVHFNKAIVYYLDGGLSAQYAKQNFLERIRLHKELFGPIQVLKNIPNYLRRLLRELKRLLS